MPAPETWEAIRKAATMAGTLISLKNWSTESMPVAPQIENQLVAITDWAPPVRIWSEITAPEIVSNARMVMTVMVFISLTSLRIVSENVKVWLIFGTTGRNNVARSGGRQDCR